MTQQVYMIKNKRKRIALKAVSILQQNKMTQKSQLPPEMEFSIYNTENQKHNDHKEICYSYSSLNSIRINHIPQHPPQGKMFRKGSNIYKEVFLDPRFKNILSQLRNMHSEHVAG